MNNDHLRFSPTFNSLVETMDRLGPQYQPKRDIEAVVDASYRFYPRFQQLRNILPRENKASMEAILNELLFSTIDLNVDSTEAFLLKVYSELLNLEEEDRINAVISAQIAADAANEVVVTPPQTCPICRSEQTSNEPCACILALEEEDGEDWQGFTKANNSSPKKIF